MGYPLSSAPAERPVYRTQQDGTLYKCRECGSPLFYKAEFESGLCFRCQARASGVPFFDPYKEFYEHVVKETFGKKKRRRK